MSCSKKKFDKIKAMLILANSNKQTQMNFNRKEVRYYYCEDCNAYQLTSKRL